MLKRFVANWAGKRALRIAESRDPDFVIGPKDGPYMLRWWAIKRNKWFNIYIHYIRHDDEDRALHDHPWKTLSLCVKGQIHEIYETGKSDVFGDPIRTSRIVKSGDWIYRGSEFAHRLELINDEPAMTIFMTGPRIREWGFLCPNGWRHWKDFIDFSSGDKGAVGRGCGEIEDFNEEGVFNEFHCRECGQPEIMIHNHGDGICRSCRMESSEDGRSETHKKIACGVIAALAIFFWFNIIALLV